jgi:hypothetical protein
MIEVHWLLCIDWSERKRKKSQVVPLALSRRAGEPE